MIELNSKILKLKPDDKNVVIIGYSAAGKTTVADLLAGMYPKYKLFRTDNYMDYGFKESLYKLRDDLIRFGLHRPKIIEGIQGVRLLRKGLELNDFFADHIFYVTAEKSTRQQRYLELRHSPEKLRYLNGFDAMMDKIYGDYQQALKKQPKHCQPRVTIIRTDHAK